MNRLLFAAVTAALAFFASGCDTCPVEATRCPGSCASIRANIYDDARECLVHPARTIGCSSSTDSSSLTVCLRRNDDDTLYQGIDGLSYELIEATSTWSECRDDERDIVTAAPVCDE